MTDKRRTARLRLNSRRSSKQNVAARQQAKEQGRTRYKAQIVCKHGHETERYTKDGSCVVCQRIKRHSYNKDWNQFRDHGKNAMNHLYDQLSGPSPKGRKDARAALERMRDEHHYSRVRNYAKELLDRFDEQLHTIPDTDS